MATLNELAVLIAEPLKRELDIPFRDMVKARVIYWRSKLMRDTLQRSPKDRMYFIQTAYFKLVSTTDCNTMDCAPTITATESEIPLPLRSNGILFDYVGAADGSSPFKRIEDYQFNYFMSDPYMPLAVRFYSYRNKRIYSNVPLLRVDFIPDNPEEVINCACNPDGSSCVLEESDFGISGEIAQQIVQNILRIDFNMKPAEEENKTEVHVDPSK